jgi:spore coat polysaccharide biosynthesis protein SpsF (cytidylyltransferase family)
VSRQRHYPVDDIDRPVACSLVIRYGINNHRTREVAVGLTILGCKYHESDILEDYCKVEVSTLIQGYKDDMLDILGPKGIKKLE